MDRIVVFTLSVIAVPRGDPGWLGDYLGAVRRDDGLFVAFTSNAGGAGQMQFLRTR